MQADLPQEFTVSSSLDLGFAVQEELHHQLASRARFQLLVTQIF